LKYLRITRFPFDEYSSAWFSNVPTSAFLNLEEMEISFGESIGKIIIHTKGEVTKPGFANLRTLKLINDFNSNYKVDCVTNIIETCAGHLQQLVLNGYTILDVELLDWLADHSHVTEGLTSFQLSSLGCNYTDQVIVRRELLKPLQFSDKLREFSWDGLHYGKYMGSTLPAKILPGILDQIAGNITSFSTCEWITSRNYLNERYPLMLIFRIEYPVQFPFMPKLSVIKVDATTCVTISLSDLVDAAPNLQRLEITDVRNSLLPRPSIELRAGSTDEIDDDEMWGYMDNRKMKEHRSLRILRVEMSLDDMTVLKKTLQKFPCLEELSIRSHWTIQTVHPINPETISEVLQQFGMNVKKLRWTSDGPHSLSGICRHLVAVGKLEHLLLYKFFAEDTIRDIDRDGYQKFLFGDPEHFDLTEFILKKEEILKELMTLRGRKCEIQVRGDQFYPYKDRLFNCHWPDICSSVVDEFRTFLRNEQLPVTLYSSGDQGHPKYIFGEGEIVYPESSSSTCSSSTCSSSTCSTSSENICEIQ
jgi:hypothetical protein